MLFQLLAQDYSMPDIESPVDVLMWPVALSILGWLIFYAGWWVQNRLTKAPWKWLAVVPVVIAIFQGYDSLSWYRGNGAGLIEGKKWIAAFYGSLIIPVLALAGIILFHFFNHKLNLPTDDE